MSQPPPPLPPPPAEPPKPRRYVPAVGDRLKKVLIVVFGLFALLSINAVYLTGVTILEWATGRTYQNWFYIWKTFRETMADKILGIRLTPADHALLDKLVARFRFLPKAALAREALRLGLRQLESEGLAALDVTEGDTPKNEKPRRK